MKELIKEVCNYEKLTNCIHNKESNSGIIEREQATNRIISYFGNKTIRESFGIQKDEVSEFVKLMLQ